MIYRTTVTTYGPGDKMAETPVIFLGIKQVRNFCRSDKSIVNYTYMYSYVKCYTTIHVFADFAPVPKYIYMYVHKYAW
jgi:hypothetical protein